MPSVYLQSADYAAFGVPNATAAQVASASALIDAYIQWPMGLLCVNDANGLPAYMASQTPDLTLVSTAAFGPGNGVQVPVTGQLAQVTIGDAVVLDRAVPSKCETVQVTGINGQVVTLGSMSANQPYGVTIAHGIGCTMETGMVITEQRYVPRGRSEVMLSYAPVARIIGGTGRYAYGRRGDTGYSNMDDFNLLSAVTQFGGPPLWELWPANNPAGVDRQTGKVWVPAGVMLAYYSEVNIRYVAGFTYAQLPSAVKQACANIVAMLGMYPELAGNTKSYRAGDTQIERFVASNLDADVKGMLSPYRARGFA